MKTSAKQKLIFRFDAKKLLLFLKLLRVCLNGCAVAQKQLRVSAAIRQGGHHVKNCSEACLRNVSISALIELAQLRTRQRPPSTRQLGKLSGAHVLVVRPKLIAPVTLPVLAACVIPVWLCPQTWYIGLPYFHCVGPILVQPNFVGPIYLVLTVFCPSLLLFRRPASRPRRVLPWGQCI